MNNTLFNNVLGTSSGASGNVKDYFTECSYGMAHLNTSNRCGPMPAHSATSSTPGATLCVVPCPCVILTPCSLTPLSQLRHPRNHPPARLLNADCKPGTLKAHTHNTTTA